MDASPCSVAGSARTTWFGSYLPERLESTDMVRLVLVRRRSDVASEEALDEAQLATWTERRGGGVGSGTSPARRILTEEAWLGQRPMLRVAHTRCLADGAAARSSRGCSTRVRESRRRENTEGRGQVRPIGFCGSVYGNRWTVKQLRCTCIFRLWAVSGITWRQPY
jgi:hypothetical protein